MFHLFNKSKVHTSDQQGPLLPQMGERRYNVKVFSRTSSFIVGDKQKHSAFDSGECKVNPIKGDRQFDAKLMDCKHSIESTRPGLNIDRCERNQSNSDVDDGSQVCSVCQYIIVFVMCGINAAILCNNDI